MTQNLLLILQRRAEARAILFSAGEFDLYEALEPPFAFRGLYEHSDFGREPTTACGETQSSLVFTASLLSWPFEFHPQQ